MSDASGRSLEGAIVRTLHAKDSAITNEKGEYELFLADSIKILVYSFGKMSHSEYIDGRNVINVMIGAEKNSKLKLSLNPKEDYPYGIQFTLAGNSLFAIAFNYFVNQKKSFEIGVSGRGLLIGGRRYFSLHDPGNNQALYVGANTSFSLEGDFILYVPIGYHTISHNGMAFSIELAGKTPGYYSKELSIFDFLGFGINFGFQF